jgi:penicillin-binding protein 1B
MKRAVRYREYRQAKPFEAPDGIVSVDIDPATHKLAAAGCGSDPVTEVFIAGTQPLQMCDGSGTQVAGWDVNAEPVLVAANAGKPQPKVPNAGPKRVAEPPPPPSKEEEPPQRKGFFGRFLDIFR